MILVVDVFRVDRNALAGINAPSIENVDSNACSRRGNCGSLSVVNYDSFSLHGGAQRKPSFNTFANIMNESNSDQDRHFPSSFQLKKTSLWVPITNLSEVNFCNQK